MSTKKLQIIGGNFGGNSIQTDDTLTKIGHAADAKATGDAILKLQADIDEVAGLVGDTDVEYYTEEEIDSMMAGLSAAIDAKSNIDHIHDEYADANHNHSYNDLTDVYVLNEEPTDASEGALWIDMDAESADVGGGTSVLIDTTLTQSGFAADAKAVGDALATKQPIGDYAAASALAALKALVGDTSVSEQIKTELESLNTQPDHNQNDPTAADYIKNRLAWTDNDGNIHKIDTKYLPDGGFGYEEEKVILVDVELNIGDPTDLASEYIVDGRIGLEAGKTYTVILDSGIYSCACKKITESDYEVLYLGNINPFGEGELANTGESFLIYEGPEDVAPRPYKTYINDLNKGTKCIIYSGGEVHGINPKFLPEGGFGWTENTEGSLTFDGDLEGKEVVPVGNTDSLVKISSDAIDLASVKEIDIMFVFKEQLTPGPTLTADNMTIIELLPGVHCLTFEDIPFVISCEKDATDETTGISLSAGTWIAHQAERVADEGMYVSFIRFDNKVDHKIDPKFLPEGGVGYEEDAVKLVEVELDSIGIAYGQVGNKTINKTIGLEAGKEYIVQTNSGTFTSVCSGMVFPKGVAHSLGNPGIMNVGAEDTGESYFILEMNDNGSQDQTHFYDGNNGTKMIVYARGEVHKIDPKYYDRLAWVEGGSGEILPETAITTVDNMYVIMNFIGLTEGSKYTVTFDGIEYETECAVMDVEGLDIRYIGNIALITGDEASNTGEHFVVAELTEDGVEATGIMTMLDDGEHTVSISGDGEIIHKVDPKFLHTPDMAAAAGEPGYIANKPLSRTSKMVRLVSDASVTNGSSIDVDHIYNNGIGVLGKKVLITYDGTQYETLITFTDGYDLETDMPAYIVFGNTKLILGELETIADNELPCVFIVDEGTLTCGFADEYTHAISIDIEAYDFNTLDYHYLPQPMTLSYNFTSSDTPIFIGDEFFDECKKAIHTMRAGQKVYANVNNILTEVIELNGIYTKSHSSDFRMKSRSLDNLIEYQVYCTDKTVITETLIQPQADYAQNDETKPDYVKNRLAWTEPRTTIMPLTTVEIITDSVGIENDIGLTEGQYIVTWDGVEYEVDCVNRSITDPDGIVHDMFVIDNTPVFYIYYMPTLSTSTIGFESSANGYASGTYTCQIDKAEVIQQINSKYIPDTIATNDYVDNAIAKIPTPDVSGQIAEHDINANAHSDIREAIGDLQTRVGDTLDALPVKVDKDGYTDIDGLRKTTSMDFSEYDEGVFYETVSGRTERYVYNIEFDDQKRPIKITDENGNECIITW